MSAYLQRPDTIAFGERPNALVTLVVRKILGSSTFAVAETLAKIIERLKTKERPSVETLVDYDAIEEVAEEARWLLAYLLDWHRREDKASWWDYFRLLDLPEEDLFDEPRAIAGLEFVECVEAILSKKGKAIGSVIDRYRYPIQEMEIR